MQKYRAYDSNVKTQYEIAMITLNPKKLLNSKWTAVQPKHKEKHFLIREVEFNEDGVVVHCLMEAIMTKHEFDIDWRDLKNPVHWQTGWH